MMSNIVIVLQQPNFGTKRQHFVHFLQIWLIINCLFSTPFLWKGPEYNFGGRKTTCSTRQTKNTISTGKLLKFYTECINCGLVTVWNTNFRKKPAHIYIRKGVEGENPLPHTTTKTENIEWKALLHKKHKFWLGYRVWHQFLQKTSATSSGVLGP